MISYDSLHDEVPVIKTPRTTQCIKDTKEYLNKKNITGSSHFIELNRFLEIHAKKLEIESNQQSNRIEELEGGLKYYADLSDSEFILDNGKIARQALDKE